MCFVDFQRKTLKCTPANPPIDAAGEAEDQASTTKATEKKNAVHEGSATTFEIPYDKLVIAVGAYSQSALFGRSGSTIAYLKLAFGTPGVKEHGYFLKDVKDARAIRTRLLECNCAPRIIDMIFPTNYRSHRLRTGQPAHYE